MIKKIREQPEHIRAIFVWLFVFISFSLIFSIWFRSLNTKLSFLLNPTEENIKKTKKEKSPYALIKENISNLTSSLLGLLNLKENKIEIINNNINKGKDKKILRPVIIKPNILPLSEEKEKK